MRLVAAMSDLPSTFPLTKSGRCLCSRKLQCLPNLPSLFALMFVTCCLSAVLYEGKMDVGSEGDSTGVLLNYAAESHQVEAKEDMVEEFQDSLLPPPQRILQDENGEEDNLSAFDSISYDDLTAALDALLEDENFGEFDDLFSDGAFPEGTTDGVNAVDVEVPYVAPITSTPVEQAAIPVYMTASEWQNQGAGANYPVTRTTEAVFSVPPSAAAAPADVALTSADIEAAIEAALTGTVHSPTSQTPTMSLLAPATPNYQHAVPPVYSASHQLVRPSLGQMETSLVQPPNNRVITHLRKQPEFSGLPTAGGICGLGGCGVARGSMLGSTGSGVSDLLTNVAQKAGSFAGSSSSWMNSVAGRGIGGTLGGLGTTVASLGSAFEQGRQAVMNNGITAPLGLPF